MIPWTDVVAVTVVAVLANHLGLIDKLESIARHQLPVLNCPKCMTFWLSLSVMAIEASESYAVIVATSFLAAYAAVWMELLFGMIDKQYEKIYKKTYPETDDAQAVCSPHAEDSTTDVPEVRE